MAAIDELFDIMIRENASDLHLAQLQPPKIRMHGSIQAIAGQPALSEARIRSLLEEICPPDRWEVFRKNRDLDFAYAFGKKARFRANYYRHANGFGAIFRVIPSEIKSLQDLGAPPILEKFAAIRSGLILVTGPTGSGKSTTLAAVIDQINRNETRTILTIEEPIEFVHPNKKSVIVQREVGIDTTSFAAALRDVTRCDFDVVLVGEMRDYETISLALSAAEKGMLVFGTLHTNNAPKTIDRIVDSFPAEQQAQARTMLSSSLEGVCSQLLVKRSDGKGRIAVHEILVRTRSLSNHIREGDTTKIFSVIQTGRAHGMILMDDSLDALLQQKKISGHDAYMKATDKQRFARHVAAAQQ